MQCCPYRDNDCTGPIPWGFWFLANNLTIFHTNYVPKYLSFFIYNICGAHATTILPSFSFNFSSSVSVICGLSDVAGVGCVASPPSTVLT